MLQGVGSGGNCVNAQFQEDRGTGWGCRAEGEGLKPCPAWQVLGGRTPPVLSRFTLPGSVPVTGWGAPQNFLVDSVTMTGVVPEKAGGWWSGWGEGTMG